MKFFLPVLFFLLFLSGCEKKILLDNTSTETLVFSVDDQETTVPAGAGIFAWIKPGQHQVKVKNKEGKIIADSTFQIKKDGLVNPFRHEYILRKQAYASSTFDSEKYADVLKEDFLIIDSMMYFGSLQIYPASFFYEKDWDYNPGEEMPEQVFLDKNEDYKISSKLYRKSDFIEQHAEMLLSNLLDSLNISADSLAENQDISEEAENE